MEKRTAPQWVLDAQKFYARKRQIWFGADALWWVGWMALLITTHWSVHRLVCVAAWVGLRILQPNKRAAAYGAAAHALSAAVARYLVDQSQPESMLDEAGRSARESLRLERIRIAPPWIRERRRQYRMKVLRWFVPAMAAMVLPAALNRMGFQLLWPWQKILAAAAPIPLMLVAILRTRKMMRAVGILGEAINRYEFESAVTDSDLEETGWRATVVVLGRSARREPPEKGPAGGVTWKR